MKTNYQMITELENDYTPKQKGVVTMAEIYKINKALCLDEMDELQLRNLRDFVVMYFASQNKYFDGDALGRDIIAMDKMSAITSVIDNKLWNIGAEV